MDVNVQELTKSEAQMMDIFWSSDEPVTSVDIVNMHIKETWSNGLVHNIIRSLIKKGLLEACGMERCGTQYTRKLFPTITREEYEAKLLVSKVKGKTSVSKVIAALIKEDDNKDDIIAGLEETIRQLQEDK